MPLGCRDSKWKVTQLLPRKKWLWTTSAVVAQGSSESLCGGEGWVLLSSLSSLTVSSVPASGRLCGSGALLQRGSALSSMADFVPLLPCVLVLHSQAESPVHCGSCSTSHVLLLLPRHVFHIAYPHTQPVYNTAVAGQAPSQTWQDSLLVWTTWRVSLLHSFLCPSPFLSPSFFFLFCFSPKLCFSHNYLRNHLNCNKQPTETLHYQGGNFPPSPLNLGLDWRRVSLNYYIFSTQQFQLGVCTTRRSQRPALPSPLTRMKWKYLILNIPPCRHV